MTDETTTPDGPDAALDRPEEAPTDETVLIDTAAAAIFHNVHPRTIRKWIEAERIPAEKIGNTYFIPVTRAELLAKGLDPDEVGRGRDGEFPGDDHALVVRRPTMPAVQSIDLEPLAQTIRELTERNVQLAAAEAEARGREALALERVFHAEERAAAAQLAADEAKARAEGLDRELTASRSALVVRDDRPGWKRFLGIK
jgi:hypothetical protein